jgi:hypothetical protein
MDSLVDFDNQPSQACAVLILTPEMGNDSALPDTLGNISRSLLILRTGITAPPPFAGRPCFTNSNSDVRFRHKSRASLGRK